MKKIYKLLPVLALGILSSYDMAAQAFSESFASVATLTATGWAQQNLSTPIGTNPDWVQGNGTSWPAYSGAATECIMVNYNSVAGANTISNWLFAPTRTFNNGDVIRFYTRGSGSAYADRLQLRLSTNGTSVNAGSTNTSVGDFTTLLLDINPTLVAANYPATWTQYTVTISGLGAPVSGRAALRYFVTNGGPTGSNSDLIAVDDFEYIPAGSAAANVTVGKYGTYTSIPLAQVTPMPLQATISNVGTAGTADAMLTVNVYQAPNLTTPVNSYTSAPATIAASASLAVTAGTFTPPGVGTYVCKFVSSCTGNTVTPADTSTYAFTVDPKEYARDNGTITTAFGIGAGPIGYIGSMYTLNTAATMDSVIFALVKPGSGAVAGDGVGDSTRITIFNVASGVPSTIIGKTTAYTFTPADTSVLVTYQLPVKDLSGAPLSLTPGTYYVAITEYNTNVGLAVCDDIFKLNSTYAGWTGQAFAPVENFGAGFAKTPVIRPSFVSCVTPVVTVNSGSICNGEAFTMVPGGATTYSYSSGSAVVSPTTTTSYTVTGDSNGCTGTAVSTVTVNPLPTVSASSTNTMLCAGESATLTASGTATSYSWSTAETTATIVVSPTGQTTYTVTGTDGNGCSGTAVSAVTVNPLPTVSASSTNTLLCTGESATLTVSGTATSYSWSTAETTASIVVSPTSQTTYTVTGVDGNGCSDMATVTEDVSTCTGIATHVLTNELAVYPNPSNGTFNINVSTTYNVTVSDVLGKVVYSAKLENGTYVIDLSSYSNGLYILKAESNGQSKTTRLVKN
jgi:hypothetical protein